MECSLEICFARFFGSFSLGVRFRLRSRVAVDCSGGSIMCFVLLIGGLSPVYKRKERIELELTVNSTFDFRLLFYASFRFMIDDAYYFSICCLVILLLLLRCYATRIVPPNLDWRKDESYKCGICYLTNTVQEISLWDCLWYNRNQDR